MCCYCGHNYVCWRSATTAWLGGGPTMHQCCMFTSSSEHIHCWPVDGGCSKSYPPSGAEASPPAVLLSPSPFHPFNPALQTALSGQTMESLLPPGGVLWGVITRGCRGDPDSVTPTPHSTHTLTHPVCSLELLMLYQGFRSHRTSKAGSSLTTGVRPS